MKKKWLIWFLSAVMAFGSLSIGCTNGADNGDGSGDDTGIETPDDGNDENEGSGSGNNQGTGSGNNEGSGSGNVDGGSGDGSGDTSGDGAGDNTTGGNVSTSEYIKHKLLTDTKFKKGLTLKGLNSATDNKVIKTINYGDSSVRNPKWNVAQWWSKHNLANGVETITDDYYSLVDKSKTLAIDRTTGAITLGVKGSEEFATYNTTEPTEWPHLLIEQNITGEYWLKNADKMEAVLDFTVTQSENKRGGTAGFHAQFAWFIYVKDMNPDSPGFGNFLWFGLNIFNSTQIYTTLYQKQDTAGGLGDFIYSLGSAQIHPGSRVKVGERKQITVDLEEHIRNALASAQANGFMIGTTFDDCQIIGNNIGWEVFDRYDVSITLHDIGINFYNKKD